MEPSNSAAKTGAHHHGPLESVIYIVKGRARMRWGERLEFTAEAGPGDFGETAEAFYGILIALPHHLHTDGEVEEHEARERERECREHHILPE